jgi:hypothetical protein
MNEKQYIAFKTFYYSDVEYAGTKAWYTNGELHRVDGPAVEWSGGGKEWYLNEGLRNSDIIRYERRTTNQDEEQQQQQQQYEQQN